jgi:hypothetical protein
MNDVEKRAAREAELESRRSALAKPVRALTVDERRELKRRQTSVFLLDECIGENGRRAVR